MNFWISLMNYCTTFNFMLCHLTSSTSNHMFYYIETDIFRFPFFPMLTFGINSANEIEFLFNSWKGKTLRAPENVLGQQPARKLKLLFRMLSYLRWWFFNKSGEKPYWKFILSCCLAMSCTASSFQFFSSSHCKWKQRRVDDVVKKTEEKRSV